MQREGAGHKQKPCLIKTNLLDSNRPSHGRRLHSELRCEGNGDFPDVLYAGGGSEYLAHADVERVMEAQIANEQVTYAGIACESRKVSEADNDQGNDGRE